VIAQIVLDVGRALYVGRLGSIGRHQAAVAAVLVGLDHPFDVIRDGVTTRTIATTIPARTEHELEIHDGRLAVLYFEPGQEVSDQFDVPLLQRSIEDALVRDDLATWHTVLRTAHVTIMTEPIESRIARVAALVSESPDELIPAEDLAAAAQLSVSRLEHLFKAQLGVPLRAYRGWYRLRLAARHLLQGASLTEAAHAAGFHDSAHFAHAFRQTFGLPPSLIFGSPIAGRVIDRAAA
jgi:AraC-like DNA-binding protein